MCTFALHRFEVILFLLFFTGNLAAADKVVSQEFIAETPTLIDSPAYFFRAFIVLLLYFPQSFEHFVRRSGKVKDPFAYCVVYGGRSDCREAGTNVFADAIRTIC